VPILIPPISPQSPSPIIGGWYNRPVVAAVLKVSPHKWKKKKQHIIETQNVLDETSKIRISIT
jgi:hypothetical protein